MKKFLKVFLAVVVVSVMLIKPVQAATVEEIKAQIIALIKEEIRILTIELNELLAKEALERQTTGTPEVPQTVQNSQTSQEAPSKFITIQPANTVIAEPTPSCTLKATRLGQAPNTKFNFKFEWNVSMEGSLFYGAQVGIGEGKTEFRYLPVGKLPANTQSQITNNAFTDETTQFKAVFGQMTCYADLVVQ